MQPLNLPKSWKEITLKMFSELDQILKDNELDQVEKDNKILSVLSDKSTEELLELS